MLRNVLAVLGGVVLGALVVFVIEIAGHSVFPPPRNIDFKDPDALRAAMAQNPLGAKLFVVGGWFAGSFAGCVLTGFLSRRWAPAIWVVAGTMLFFIASTLATLPHPGWMMLAGFAGAPLAGILAIKATRAKYGPPPGGKPRDPIAGL
jgi:MFS family permease